MQPNHIRQGECNVAPIHGHLDRFYHAINRRVRRSKFNIWLYRKITPDWAIPLAKWVSGSSRQYTARRDHVFAKDYRDYAKTKVDAGYDIVAIGHLHIPVLERFDRGAYVNTGDFINYFTYAKLTGKEITLHSLTDVSV